MSEQESKVPNPTPVEAESVAPQETPHAPIVSPVNVEAAPAIETPTVTPRPSEVAAPAPTIIRREVSELSDTEVEHRMRAMSRRSFLSGAVAVATAFAGWKWLITRRDDNGIPWPFRRVLDINEQLARDYFQDSRLAPIFGRELARIPKENGDIGLPDDFDPSSWKLHVYGLADLSATSAAAQPAASTSAPDKKGGAKKPPVKHTAPAPSADSSASDNSDASDSTSKDNSDSADNSSDSSADASNSESTDAGMTPMTLSLADIKKLPRIEMTTQLKCIEGWSVIVHWAGARLADFIAKYPPMTLSGDPPDVHKHPEDLPQYVSLETPDGAYYVGLDLAAAMHPQTLLCYEMNGESLPLEHGAPLRLVIPVKYGIKHIKRIGKIRFTNQRPADYWAEQGYDWYAGH